VRQLDEKGRLAIPAEYLDLLVGTDRDALYITPGKQGCAWLIPPSYYGSDFAAIAKDFEAAGGAPDQFFHDCQRRTLDKAGRLLVDEDARLLAGIPEPSGPEKISVVVCGSGRYLQLWFKPDYDARAIPARQISRNLQGGGNAFNGGRS
jgi:DNA-binding transcriptional regulator/RsmH inhibitor MraZ